MKPLHYLGGPFSDPNPVVRDGRYTIINRAATVLIQQGEHVLSPVSMFYPIDNIMSSDSMGSDFWTEYVLRFASVCEKFTIVGIPGWKTSNGVRREIEHFAARGIEPTIMDIRELTACQ